MTPVEEAKQEAYHDCARKAGQRADQLERSGCFRYARECRQLEDSFNSMAHSVRKQAEAREKK